MYSRILRDKISARMGKGKAIVVVGPRQVGKTTLIHDILQPLDHLFLDGDDPLVREMLDRPTTEQLKSIIGEHPILFIDEAQRLAQIGVTLKIITDQFKKVQLIVSGSSSFDLGRLTNEPLTGRKWEYEMYPLSWAEIEQEIGPLRARQQLDDRLLYGSYPDILNHPGEEKDILQQLSI